MPANFLACWLKKHNRLWKFAHIVLSCLFPCDLFDPLLSYLRHYVRCIQNPCSRLFNRLFWICIFISASLTSVFSFSRAYKQKYSLPQKTSSVLLLYSIQLHNPIAYPPACSGYLYPYLGRFLAQMNSFWRRNILQSSVRNKVHHQISLKMPEYRRNSMSTQCREIKFYSDIFKEFVRINYKLKV